LTGEAIKKDMQNDLILIFRVYLITLVWQVGFWPVIKNIFSKSPDQGWSVTRVAFSLVVALITWQMAHLGLPVNTEMFIFTIGSSLLILSVWKYGLCIPKGDVLRNILITEYFFILGLFGVSMVRGFAPNIDSLEKFMDYGFINRYLISPTLPAMDMWQAGSQINYYSFGHYWASILNRLWWVDLARGYNLILGFLAGSAFSMSFGVIQKFLGEEKGRRVAAFSGVLGSLMVVLGGNGHAIWYLVGKHSFSGYWYADATRFIHNTIHEFPAYSFVVSDLHGHLIDLPVVLFLLYLFYDWLKFRERKTNILMGILFGIMMMTNTWDVAVYGLLMTIAGIGLLWKDKDNFPDLIVSAMTILGTMFLTSLLWWWSFQSISQGIMLVKERSPLWQLGVLWSLGSIVLLLAVWWSKKEKQRLLVLSLCLTIVALIVIPEIIYAKDIYPDHPRANTMFKLTYQASILIGILFGVISGYVLDFSQKISVWQRSLVATVLLFVWGSAMFFPFQSFPSFYGGFKEYYGLNGERWIKKESEEKWEMIMYLRNQRSKSGNLVEAVGDSYTKLNMVSVFTGIPTIQGWRVHEWLWRGGYDSVAKREAEVRLLYETEDVEKTKKILQKYQIRWIVVGVDERKAYSVNHEKLWSLGEVVWKNGDAYILEVR